VQCGLPLPFPGQPPAKYSKPVKVCQYFNPEFAIGRGIRQTMPDFFFRKKLNRMQRYAFAFFVKKASASFASVLAPIAKSGFKFIDLKEKLSYTTINV